MGGLKCLWSLQFRFWPWDDGLIILGLFCVGIHPHIILTLRSNSDSQIQASAIGIETEFIYQIKHKHKHSL